MKIGMGYDIHRFKEGRKLILGGIEIPHTSGLEGHSDADVLLHAICDALLGAAGFEDIGHQFPNTDVKFKDISSLLLLEKVMALINGRNMKIANIDSVIILEEPKVYPFINAMKENISRVTGCGSISIKATTSEGIGPIGTKEGCAAYAVALLD